jgi:hypothetical protein
MVRRYHKGTAYSLVLMAQLKEIRWLWSSARFLSIASLTVRNLLVLVALEIVAMLLHGLEGKIVESTLDIARHGDHEKNAYLVLARIELLVSVTVAVLLMLPEILSQILVACVVHLKIIKNPRKQK